MLVAPRRGGAVRGPAIDEEIIRQELYLIDLEAERLMLKM